MHRGPKASDLELFDVGFYFVIAYFTSYGTKVVDYERTDALLVALVASIGWFEQQMKIS